MSDIKAIIFDCFGVLTTDIWKEFLDTLPPEIDKDALRLLNYQFDKGQISQEDFTFEVGKISGSPVPKLEFLSDDQLKSKNTKLLDYIKELKSQYKVGMLSNISSNWIRDTLLTSEEQQLFDDMVMSFEVGLAKPSVEIFELAVNRLRVRPEDCVFIDDIEANCQVAQSLGIQSIIYKDFEKLKKELDKIIGD